MIFLTIKTYLAVWILMSWPNKMATSSDSNNSISEENHNKNTINSKQLLIWNTYGHKYRHCHFCSGFYGSNYGEPVCQTCHIFLFPDDINAPDDVVHILEKGDDDDSGNDEPSDFLFLNNQSQNRPYYNSTKPDRLAERIKLLTIPKEDDVLTEGLVELLPAEVLLIVFSHLDDISLWSCGQVCRRWHNLVYSETPQEQWKKFCCRRWPIYTPNCKSKVQGWKSMYTKLIKSTPCLYCLHQMTMQVNLPVEENSWRRNRLKNELKALRSDPPEGIEAIPLDRTWSHWQSSILGPGGSPYEGGRFFLYIQIPHSYPMRPPVVRFITKIFHPNVSRHGDIGIDSIHHNWSLALTISKVLISIQSLLTDPYCHICMEPEIGSLYADDRPTFDRLAKTWTRSYAVHDSILLNSEYCKFLESG